MIQVTIYEHQKEICGFDCLGHAEFAEKGQDIVCAGVSSLVLNTINSIQTFTNDSYEFKSNEDDGFISLSLKDKSRESAILLKSLALGLQGIQNNYGDGYIFIRFKEV